MKTFPTLLSYFLLSMILFPACEQPDPGDLSSYYFPYEKYEDGAVLEFRPVKVPELGKEFWYVKSFSDSEKKFLVTQVFNEALELQQYKLEEYVENGVLAREVRLLRRTDDTSALIRIDIRQNGVFPFSFQDSLTRYVYELSWHDPIDSMEYRLTRNRRITHMEDRMFLGQLRPSWHTMTIEELETIADGSTLSSWSGEEWFAPEIGLVYFRKQITPEFAREYYLHEVHPWEEFERTIGPSLIAN